MFTGLVKSLGQVRFLDAYHLEVRCLEQPTPSFLGQLEYGDSVAVDGICLTVEQIQSHGFIATTSPETLRRTTLALPDSPTWVNLEPSLRVGDKLGGHFVTGHIDGIGYLNALEETSQSWQLGFQVPSASPVSRYLVPKGSIAVNGVSLTIASCDAAGTQFTVAVIPVTFAETNLQYLKPGNAVNLEGDILGKYVEKLLSFQSDSGTIRESTIDLAFLREHGYEALPEPY